MKSKKFIVKETGKTVALGEELTLEQCEKSELINAKIVCTLTLTEAVADLLVSKGILEEVKEFPIKEVDYYIEKACKRLNFEDKSGEDAFICLIHKSPYLVLSLLLKEIAMDLDNQYPDHISKSKEIYAVSITNGGIFKLNKSNIVSYRNFAAFRTEEDAKYACLVLRDLISELFSERK